VSARELLTDAELRVVTDACAMASDLVKAKEDILDYVESKMYFLAPNLTHICGATIAAKMLGTCLLLPLRCRFLPSHCHHAAASFPTIFLRFSILSRCALAAFRTRT